MELFARSSVGAWAPSSPEHGSVRSPRLARLLRSAELRRHLLRAGDAAAGVCAVVGALWSWSFIDGDPLTAQYVREHAEWFVMAGVWVLLLYPAYRSNAAFSTRDSATVLAHAVSVRVSVKWNTHSGMWNTHFGEVERSSERNDVERSVPPSRFATDT